MRFFVSAAGVLEIDSLREAPPMLNTYLVKSQLLPLLASAKTQRVGSHFCPFSLHPHFVDYYCDLKSTYRVGLPLSGFFSQISMHVASPSTPSVNSLERF